MNKFRIDPEWLEEIFSNIRDGILVVDLDLHVIYANEAVKRLGFYPKNVIGKSIFSIFPNLTKETSSLMRVLSTKKPITDQTLSFVTYRGERKTTLTSTYPIFHNGELIGIYEVFQDISAIEELSSKLMSLQKKQRQSLQDADSTSESQCSSIHMIIGKNKKIRELKKKIPTLAQTSSPILIYGETGSGKELVVQAIYESASRHKKNMPLVAQNCAAIPETLLEGILFGTVKGGFTGAENRPGLFELAHEGILFLDEINSMPTSLQAKLLRVLQEGKVRRVGGQKEIDVDVRLISATNVHPSIILNEGELRKDLYYRLNVIYLELPPLRDRKEDIPELAQHFIAEYNQQFQKSILGIDQEVMNFFTRYHWPGNIRELRNLIERAMNLAEGNWIRFNDIQPNQIIPSPPKAETFVHDHDEPEKLREAIKNLEIRMIKQALVRNQGNVSASARQLDLPQQTLNNKIEKYQLRPYVYQLKMEHQK